MRRYNIVSRILLILTAITFALAVPVPVQEKRRSRVDKEHVPEDVITVLGKRTREQDMLRDGLRLLWGNRNPGALRLQRPAPPPDAPPPNPAEVHVPEEHVPPQPENPAGVHVPEPGPEIDEPPQNPADSDHESMELDDDAPPGSPESGPSHSQPTSPKWSAESEDWHTAPPSVGSSTVSGSDPDRWSTISNPPSAESQSENLNAVDAEMRGNAKVSRRISGTASDVHTRPVNAAQMELRSAVDPGRKFLLLPFAVVMTRPYTTS
jgi:hypothetical protein